LISVKNARDIFLEIIAGNRKGRPKGIYSVCSANAAVLEACCRQALEDGTILVVESTSNQVDQEGGYTGMRPGDFIDHVKAIARQVSFPENMILMGGDHLGPNKWQDHPAGEAMHHAKVLVEAYVKAGCQKIHLDTSMFCADDSGDRSKPLSDDIVASRTAALCRAAEDAWKDFRPADQGPVYIIGTEVPPPGGVKNNEEMISPTKPGDAVRTIEVTRQSFVDAGLRDAWERVVGVVVQPGVEYGDDRVYQYHRARAAGLSSKITGYDRLVYEAHSTDYQTESSLKELVEDHFCILKVGPWLTFAYREALFALEFMETEIMGKGNDQRSHLRDTMERVMLEQPGHWEKYYSGTRDQQMFKRKYSFSDRSRYYWPDPSIESARLKLMENLGKNHIPLSLISQFMPSRYDRVLNGELANDPMELVADHIRDICRIYSRACGLSKM
jgi:D-tagatose-1,6-bisphosphate aldolase subunit GatZ/KbaZ